MAMDKDTERGLDKNLEVNSDSWESGDEVGESEVKEDGHTKEGVEPSMEMEMNPVFLLMHHIEVNLVFISFSSDKTQTQRNPIQCKQVLNLTGSLIEEVDPVDKLEYINFIENLTVLELGENQVRTKI